MQETSYIFTIEKRRIYYEEHKTFRSEIIAIEFD